jgi:hypothetical protein
MYALHGARGAGRRRESTGELRRTSGEPVSCVHVQYVLFLAS